jgi:DNA/RNA-binding domain of Phe-tRNA-synthetase-like protein
MLDYLSIYFSPTIQDKIPGLKIGVLSATGFEVKKQSDFVTGQFTDLEKFVKNKFSESTPSADRQVSSVRRMYRRIGWEPTQYRPSSEAMIRRFLKDKGLYRINNAVDLGNVASARFHIPMGLYDVDKLSGSISVDVGLEGEEYEGISKDVIHAEGKLVLRDEEGVFGNPTADSIRTSIQNNTKNILALFFTPPDVEDSYINQTLEYMKNLYESECLGVLIEIEVVKCCFFHRTILFC